jgi:hypothetical protein
MKFFRFFPYLVCSELLEFRQISNFKCEIIAKRHKKMRCFQVQMQFKF